MSAEKSQFQPIPAENVIFKDLTDAVRLSLPNAQGLGTKEEGEEEVSLRIEKVIKKSPYQS